MTTAISALAINDTLLKCAPVMADTCEVTHPVKAGSTLDLCHYYDIDDSQGLHDFFRTTEALGVAQDRGWWAYGPDWQITGTEESNHPVELEIPKLELRPVVPTMKVPGISRLVKATDPVLYYGSTPSNFTWGEFTKNCQRVPVSEAVTRRIIELTKYMDRVREYLGSHPIRVTSGYRDPVSNDAVGGARWSQHLLGNAIDFWIPGLDLVEVFYKLKDWGDVPAGLAIGNGFVHIDQRLGAKARWHYRGGPNVTLW